jgi:hypothetical protein
MVQLADDRLLGQLRASLALAEPWHLYGSFAQQVVVPSVFDLSASASLVPESLWTGELGTALALEGAEVALLGYLTRAEDAIEAVAASVENWPTPVWLYGFESRAKIALGPRFVLKAAIAMSQADQRVAEERAITGRASLRYVFETRSAFIEVALRATAPLGSGYPLDAQLPPDMNEIVLGSYVPTRFLRATLRAGSDLGAGFRVLFVVENFLDAAVRLPGSAFLAPGVDLRFSLIHTFQ